MSNTDTASIGQPAQTSMLYGPQLDLQLDSINAFHSGARMHQGAAAAGLSAGAPSYNSRQQQQQQQQQPMLPPLSFHNTVTSGMPLPDQKPELGSLESAQFAADVLVGRGGALDSLNSVAGNAVCRTALFNNPGGGQAAARNIVLTVAPKSGGGRGGDTQMETMPSAESQKAEPPADTISQPQPSGAVSMRGLRNSARRNPPRYSDFIDDLSDTDSQEHSFFDDEDLEASSEGASRGVDLRSRCSSLESADASKYRALVGGSAGGEARGRSSGGMAPKRPRSKTLLCEQDPEAPGLTLEQRRKIRRRINNRASARRVRQKREEELQRISAQVATLDHEKQQLAARVSQSQASCGQLAMQLKQIRERWQMTCLTNATLHKELMNLRDTWQRSRVRAPSMAPPATMTSMGPPAMTGAAKPAGNPLSRMGERPSFSNLPSLDLASFLAN